MGDVLKPRKVLFDRLRKLWGVEHMESYLLFDSLASGAEDKYTVNRFVSVDPDDYGLASFKPFDKTSAMVVSSAHSSKRNVDTNERIVEFLAGEGCDEMCESLRYYGSDDVLFRNTMTDIANEQRLSDADRANLAMMLYCESGCTGDVPQAVAHMKEANKIMGARFRTVVADGDTGQAGDPSELALVRVDPGTSGRYVLSTDSEGTVIGRSPTAPNAITNVDGVVSKNHARIWRDEEGSWWIEGLGSTNGTVLLDAGSDEEVVVEPPAAEREAGKAYGPVPLRWGDQIVLAGSTTFWVSLA